MRLDAFDRNDPIFKFFYDTEYPTVKRFRWDMKVWRCRKCQRKCSFSLKHDEWYCLRCDLWRAAKCSPPEEPDIPCVFCSARPDKPSEITQ